MLKYHYFLADYATPNIIKLEKNEQKSYDIELSNAYGNIQLMGKYRPRAYFSEGKYSVMLKHGTDYLKEIIYSNKIEFSSKTPENNDLNIFNRLIYICKIYDVKFTDWENYNNDLKRLYYDNNSNIYSEEIFYNYFQNTLMILDIPEHKEYGKLFNDRFIGECEAFLDKNPDTYYSGKILEGLLPNYVRRLNKSKAEAYYYLKGLMNKYPNTKIHSAVINYLSNTKYINRFFERRKNRELNK
ncbi:MAG: hypothetical protein PHN88_13370 [Ignavibacteria bacterium]|nr:hypothetical protein [Ignavibacteria bacterium]